MKHKPITLQLRKRLNLLGFFVYIVVLLNALAFMYVGFSIKSLEFQIENQDLKISHIYEELESKYQKMSTSIEDRLLDAMEIVESGRNPKAYNKYTGAVGVLQLTPIVYDKICNMTKEEAFEYDRNRACAKIYLTHLLKLYNGNITKAIRHYNQGYLKVETKYVEKVQNVLASNE